MNIREQLDKLLEQEKTLVFERFENADALELGYTLAKRLENSDRPIAIVIRIGEHTVFQYTMKGKEDSHYGWANRKANLVEAIGHSSYYGTLAHQYLGEYNEYETDEERFAFAIGGFPLNVKEHGRIGVIGLSGLKDPQDHIEVVTAIKTIITEQEGKVS